MSKGATCEVIAREAKLYVFPNCELQAGVRMACLPVTVLQRDGNVDGIGRAVLDALQMFRTDVPFPDDYERAANDVLKDTGFKNWRAFSKGAQRLGVRAEGAKIVVTPTVADARGGYADLEDESIKVRAEPAPIGSAVVDAFGKCEFRARIG